MTRQEQIIDQVSAILYERICDFDVFEIEDAQKENEEKGFSFNLRWLDKQYKNRTTFDKVRHLKLDETTLQTAWTRAQSFILDMPALIG